MTPRGRKTRQEEIETYLAGLDLPPEVLDAIRQADPLVALPPLGDPATFVEMRDRAAQELWAYFQSATGVAKVQAFKAIDEMAARESAGAKDQEPEPFIADVVADVGNLAPARRRQILTEARTRLEEELQAIERVLREMDAA